MNEINNTKGTKEIDKNLYYVPMMYLIAIDTNKRFTNDYRVACTRVIILIYHIKYIGIDKKVIRFSKPVYSVDTTQHKQLVVRNCAYCEIDKMVDDKNINMKKRGVENPAATTGLFSYI